MGWDGKIYDKYRIEHTDGTPLKGKKYFVLRLDSDDPAEAARVAAAMRAYKSEPRNCDVGAAMAKERSLDMTLQELKKMARRGIAKWCDGLPQDGDYREPELITDRWAGNGRTPQDGDYALIVLFHNRNEEGGAK